MKIKLDFSGIEETLKQLEDCATDKEQRAANKRVVERSQPIVKKAMQGHIPVSADNATSGKIGYRPGGHAKENVPISKIRTSGTQAWAEVGWTLGDSSEYFYMKFVEWGTWKMPPRDFIEVAIRETEYQIAAIAEQEYKALIARKLGG
ncbi:MAG: HK97-gp10 family putative phage morphogenesis protein [Oscillospiraceae bacterium]|nr:HK97-gp10 family putative phage morphogenesis protein [Oscillospiraceae bacterium]